jgi:hypothetical protein
MRAKKITLKEMLSQQAMGLGHGLYGHEVRQISTWHFANDPYDVVRTIDLIIITLANKRNWTATQLFEFMDSKMGRWAGDEMMSNDPLSSEKTRAVIKKYMDQFSKAQLERYRTA